MRFQLPAQIKDQIVKKVVAVAVFVLIASLPAFARKHKLPPPAPLPSQVTEAKTVFLVNGGGSDLAFDAFYQEFKAWGKYQLVGSPEKADLVITLEYDVQKNGTSEVPVYNSYTRQTTYYSRENVDPQLRMSISDAKTKAELWSAVDHRRLARLESNREKETVKSAVRLVDDLKERSQQSQE